MRGVGPPGASTDAAASAMNTSEHVRRTVMQPPESRASEEYLFNAAVYA
jgi:hypothetical protein